MVRHRASLSGDALFVAVPKLLAGAALVALNVWMATVLGPASYGIFAFCVSWMLLLDSTVGAAVDLGVVRMATAHSLASDSYAVTDTRAGVAVKAILVAVAIAAAAIGGERAGWRLFHEPGGRVLFLVTAAAAGGLLLVRSAQTHSQLVARFGRFGAIDLAHTALRAGLVGAVVVAGRATPAIVLACYAAASAATAAIALPRAMRGGASAAWLEKARCRDLVRFLRIAGSTFAVGAIVARLDLFALALAATPVQLGLYSAAFTLATIPELLGSYLAPAFTPRILPYSRDGRIRRLFRSTQAVLVAIAVVATAICWATADRLVPALLPASYAPTTALLKVLIIAGLAGFITFPLTLHFVMFAAPRTFVLMDGVTAPLVFGANVWAAGRYGALGVACVTASSRLVKAALIQIYAARLASGSVESERTMTGSGRIDAAVGRLRLSTEP